VLIFGIVKHPDPNSNVRIRLKKRRICIRNRVSNYLFLAGCVWSGKERDGKSHLIKVRTEFLSPPEISLTLPNHTVYSIQDMLHTLAMFVSTCAWTRINLHVNCTVYSSQLTLWRAAWSDAARQISLRLARSRIFPAFFSSSRQSINHAQRMEKFTHIYEIFSISINVVEPEPYHFTCRSQSRKTMYQFF
jgi:hypothetical protein